MDLQPLEKIMVGVDAVGCSINDIVYWVGGAEAKRINPTEDIPSDCLIVGIADKVNIG